MNRNFIRQIVFFSYLLFLFIIGAFIVAYFTFYHHASLFGGAFLGYFIWILMVINLMLTARILLVTLNYFLSILMFMSRLVLYFLAGLLAIYVPSVFNFCSTFLTLVIMFLLFYFYSFLNGYCMKKRHKC